MGILKDLLPDKFYKYYLRLKNAWKPEVIIREPEELIQKRQEFYRQFVKPGGLVYDVGANFGNRIIPMLRIGARVVAIEPQEKCYTYLKTEFGGQIELVKMGLGEKEEIRDFYISNSSTISTFSNEWLDKVKEGRFRYYSWNKTEKVKMTTLDNLIRQFGMPDFIKIDVEGFELEVLKGLHCAVNMISIEYNVPENQAKTVECIDYLSRLQAGARFNYSVGESMQLQLSEWIDRDAMINLLHTESFIGTSFGDIYIKNQLQ